MSHSHAMQRGVETATNSVSESDRIHLQLFRFLGIICVFQGITESEIGKETIYLFPMIPNTTYGQTEGCA